MTKAVYSLFISCLLVTATLAQSANEQAANDAKNINEMARKYRAREFRDLFTASFFGNEFEEKVKGYREHHQKLEAFEEKELPQIRKARSELSAKYGKDVDAIRKKFRTLSDGGASIPGDPAYSWNELGETAAAPAEARQKLADKLVEMAESAGQTAQGYERLTAAESFDRAKKYLELAILFQPDHAEAKQKLAGIDKAKETRLESDEKAIDEAEFGPHATSFQGNPESMADIAFQYLSTRESGKDGKLLAVRIAGDWHPHDTTLGVTITWGLPVEAAYRIEDDPETARVVSMNLVTQEEHPEPPFQRFAITGERLMRVRNLPSQGGAGGFGLMRLLLSLALILLGFVGAGPLIQTKLPPAQGVLDKLAPYSALLGVITLALGAAALLLSLLSPFRDLLPQAAAIALGLGMGLDLLIKPRATKEKQAAPADNQPAASAEKTEEGAAKPADDLKEHAQEALDKAGELAEQAVTKAQDLLIEKQEQIRKLDLIRIPLAIGCIVLGVIHLLAGGMWLV